MARWEGSALTRTLVVYLSMRMDDMVMKYARLYLVIPIRYSVADLELPRYTIIYLKT